MELNAQIAFMGATTATYCIREGVHRIGYVLTNGHDYVCYDRDNVNPIDPNALWIGTAVIAGMARKAKANAVTKL